MKFNLLRSGEPQAGTLTYAGKKFDGFLEEFLPPGVYAFGNNSPDITWNKVLNGKRHFETIVQNAGCWKDRQNLLQALIDLLTNREKYTTLILFKRCPLTYTILH